VSEGQYFLFSMFEFHVCAAIQINQYDRAKGGKPGFSSNL